MTSSTPFGDCPISPRLPADPLPTTVLKQVVDLLSPFITELFSRSSATGHFRQAFITPIAKKPRLYATDVSSSRPTSNLSVLSKLVERPVARQLMEYKSSADLLPHGNLGFDYVTQQKLLCYMYCLIFCWLSILETWLP